MWSAYPIDFTWQRLADLIAYDATRPLLFSSGSFLWLFTGFMLIYALLRHRTTARLLFVVAFSYYFYYKSSGTYFFLLAIVTLADFFLAQAMGRTSILTKRKLYLTLSLMVNLGLLAYFKYTNFFLELLASLWHSTFTPLDIFLPIGISFFVFQSMSYTIDVYRQRIVPLTSLLDYAFFVSFFPTLVAGPIIRAAEFIPQIRRPLGISRAMIGRGLFLIACGLIKKVVISDYISVNFVERVFDAPALYSGVENLLAVYGYALQIYCDFSGYSDMAIGLAALLGFRFPDNFRAPYMAISVTDFWRRWHISLSTWLRDYLYIGLGGNRLGRLRQGINLFITMLLGGLWHGAALHFLLWGILHGVALVVEKWCATLWPHWERSRTNRILGWVITFHFVCLCWLVFRHEHVSQAWLMLTQIATAFNGHIFLQVIDGYAAVITLIVLGYIAHFLPQSWSHFMAREWEYLPIWQQAAFMTFIVYVVIQFQNSAVKPFIYFQF
ncbi:MAG: MBOAT family O-acyltransferase [Bacteroidales bacterium]|nr:MBOAT family O-acyltransferase [Bacteroidales bacterium]